MMKKYSEEAPTQKGLYVWEANHKHRDMKELSIVFASIMRMRGAGFESVLSPKFDYWDGYRVHVPDDVEWRALDAGETLKDGEIITVNGLTPAICPFCGALPEVKFTGFIGCTPIDADRYWIKCCSWISSPTYANPLVLIERWNEKVGNATNKCETNKARRAEK